MCIRDRVYFAGDPSERKSSGSYFTPEDVVNYIVSNTVGESCLLYTSDAADDLLCVDLGGRRIIKKKTTLLVIVTDIQRNTEPSP